MSVHYGQVSGAWRSSKTLYNGEVTRNTNTVCVLPYYNGDQQEMAMCCLCYSLATVEDLYLANPFSLSF